MATKKPKRSSVKKPKKASGKNYSMPSTIDGMNKMMKQLMK